MSDVLTTAVIRIGYVGEDPIGIYGPRFDRWLAEHDAEQKSKALYDWADYQQGVLERTGVADDDDRAEVANWTTAARAYADQVYGPSRENAGTE